MRRINISKKEWIRGSLLVAAGLIVGALVFSPSGSSRQYTHVHNSNRQDRDSVQAEGPSETVYTCSMHPQVRQNEPGDCPICGMELIPAEKTKQGSEPAELRMTQAAIKLADIQTTEVIKTHPEKEIRLTGKVEVDERRIYTQASHFPGRIEKLYVEFKGEQIEKGEVIASIYSPELIAAQEELLEASKTSHNNPELLAAARKKLKQWKLDSGQIAAIEERGKVTEHMKIRSDISGVVHKQMVNEGDYIRKGTSLYHIARVDEVWVTFDAYQEDVPMIDDGDRIRFTVSSMPGQTFTSTVTFIDPIMNEKSRVARVRAEAPNTNGHLKPGMFAEGILVSNNAGRGMELVVPKSAVMWTGKRSVVYVRQPDRERPVFRMREVVLGPSLEKTYIIEEGLRPGEKVVTHGTFAVDAAAQLAGKPSMMNPVDKETTGGHQHEGPTMKSSSPEGEKQAESPEKTDVTEWPASEAAEYKKLIEAYLKLKNRLVNDQKEAAQAGNLLEALQAVDMKAFSASAHHKWMKGSETIEKQSRLIREAPKLEEQRRHFIDLSNAMISLVRSFRTPENTLYVQFCPMADDNQGAFWLSSEDQVRNPYYGDMMLTCGEVKEEISSMEEVQRK